MNYDFTDKVALVTGGTSGIGLATARAFASCGASVVIAARREAEGRAAEAMIEREGGRALFVATDVCREDDVERLVARAVDQFGGLHLAFNNAGIGGDMQPLDGATTEAWDAVMATNARSVFVGMRHQIPAILDSGGGAIVNMSAIYGCAGKAAHHAYVASKHAVIGLTRSVALEMAERGVRVNAICPGATETEAMKNARAVAPQIVSNLVDAHPMRRLASEQEIAAAVLWLCSADASFVTGHPLAVDGGFLAA